MEIQRKERDFAAVHTMAMIPEGKEGTCTVIYLLEPLKNMGGLEDYVEKGRGCVVSVFGMDWDRDLTPWPSPRAFKKGNDFSGDAPSFLLTLTEEILPKVESDIQSSGIRIGERYLVGISLGGLFCLWAAHQTSLFTGIGSISGSLWYDGIVPFFETTPISDTVKKIYLSLGESELSSRNPRLSTVGENTLLSKKIFEEEGVTVKYEINPGNHFSDAVPRLRKAIDYLLSS